MQASVNPPSTEEWKSHFVSLIKLMKEGVPTENETFIMNRHNPRRRGGKGIGRHAAAATGYYSFVRNTPKKKETVPEIEVVSPSEQVLQQAKALPDKEDLDINIRSDEPLRKHQYKARRRGGKTIKRKTSGKKKNKK